MELKDFVAEMRALGIRRLEIGNTVSDGEKLLSFTPRAIELFDPTPPTHATEPAPPLDLLDALEPKLEVKAAGICCVRGCSEPSGGAMAGRLSPEMCRDHALQLGGGR